MSKQEQLFKDEDAIEDFIMNNSDKINNASNVISQSFRTFGWVWMLKDDPDESGFRLMCDPYVPNQMQIRDDIERKVREVASTMTGSWKSTHYGRISVEIHKDWDGPVLEISLDCI